MRNPSSFKPVVLNPYVCGLGASTPGAEFGPGDLYAFRVHMELSARLGEDVQWSREPENGPLVEGKRWRVIDPSQKRRSFEEAMRAKEAVISACHQLKDDTVAALRRGAFPVSIGGDHSMGIATAAGVAVAHNAHERTGVLWIDAHPDLNTPETSYSGSMHGMSLSALHGLGDPDYVGIAGDRPVISPGHACVFGARSIDDAEWAVADRLGVRIITMDEINNRGVVQCFNEALGIVTEGTDRRVMSFDIDSLSTGFDLATGTVVPNGLLPDEMLPLLERVNVRQNFDALEIPEFNPCVGDRRRTEELIIHVMDAALS